MKNILVPTDFSPTAKNALIYAEALAKDIDAHLKVVNVCHPSTDTADGFLIPSLEELKKAREEKLDQFVFKSNGENDINSIGSKSSFDQEVVIGYAGDVLPELSKDEQTDLILMGTTGEGGVLMNLFGSISSKVAQNSGSPVWLIPPESKYTGLKKIVYAGNYQSADEKTLNEIRTFAETFDAALDIIHVNTSKNKDDFQMEAFVVEELFKQKYPDVNFHAYPKEGAVWESINNYAEEQEADLIVLVTRERTFRESIFHKRTTRPLILNTKTPILILHSEKV